MPDPMPAVQICEYHGREFIWTHFSQGWARGGPERYSLAQVEEMDGPLTPVDYIGTAPAILAEMAALTAERDRLERAIAELQETRRVEGRQGADLFLACARLRAELDLQRPVIEAARAYVAQHGPFLRTLAKAVPAFENQTSPRHQLVVAVDVLDAAPAPGPRTCRPTATTCSTASAGSPARRARRRACARATSGPSPARRAGPMAADLHLTPVTFAAACGFVTIWHRHHTAPVGHRYSIGVADGLGVLRGVAIVGRPVARSFDDGATVEVTRLATDGTANAGSMLYAACWRAASALGYRRLVTYTQGGEGGGSLRAAGYRVIAQRPARAGWSCPSRPREDRGVDGIPRTLWEVSDVHPA